MRNSWILVLWIMIAASSLTAQITAPVQITGQLIPPHSLRVGDYFNERSSDLMFAVTLVDPVETTRQVQLRLTVQTDGGTVLATPAGFAPLLTLDQNIPLMLDGSDLLPYWQNIQPVNGSGVVPTYLPAGLNGICLEVIDVVSGKVISNRGCAQAFFVLAQPPRLQSPVCDGDIEATETQNILFNWLPMHTGSGALISSVRYEFEMVEMGPAFQNAQDAFNAGMVIYSQELFDQTSINYTDADTPLERGKTYAWRVRANALTMDMQEAPLFANNGYSEKIGRAHV